MPSSLNGTGVTFNDGTTLQSGNIPAANLGSGTADSNTFLRGDRTFATPPSQAPTTAQVLSATAGAAAGAVGTYAFGWRNSTATPPVFGATIAGSQLRPAGFTSAPGVNVATDSTQFPSTGNINGSAGSGRSTFAGTWRCMGEARQLSNTQGNYPHTLWLRIS